MAHESKVWGGYTVHYLVGTLERIPFLNCLVVLVDLVVSSILTRLAGYIIFSQPISAKLQNKCVQISIESFFGTHKIQINPSPLLKAIQEIQKIQGNWTQSSNDVKWDARLNNIKDASSRLLCLMGSEKKQSQEYQQLENIQKDKTQSGYTLFTSFKKITEHLQSIEEGLSERWFSSLNSALQSVQRPVIQSLDDYLQMLGPDKEFFRDHYYISTKRTYIETRREDPEEFPGLNVFNAVSLISKKTLRERGIEDLQDIDCLGLRRHDQMELNLILFETILEKEFDRPEIQEAYQKYLKYVVDNYVRTYPSTLDRVKKRTSECQSTSPGYDRLKQKISNYPSAFDKFKRQISNYLTAEKKELIHVKAITEQFRVIYRSDQTQSLLSYLRQDNILDAWQSIKTSIPGATLKDYCGFNQIAEPSLLYQLGAAFNPEGV